MKGDASFMGVEKILDDIDLRGERKGEHKGREDVAK